MNKALFSLFFAGVLGAQGLVVPGPGDGATGALREVLDAIDAGRIRTHVGFLADPRREGRGLGTRGLEQTARYLAREMEKAGLSPLPGQSAFEQAVPLRRISALGGGLALPGGKVLRHGTDCLVPGHEPMVIRGELVDVGFGIQEPALERDDYKGLDLKGKIAVVRPGLPEGQAWHTPELVDRWASTRPGERYDSRLEILERLGAVAVVALDPEFRKRLAEPGESAFFRPEAGVRVSEEPPLVLADPQVLGTGAAAIEITGRVEAVQSLNLVGCLPGADPALASEAVVIGAHMDHLGMAGGQLHPGADDNGSGVSAVLEMIRILAARKERPRRTVVFAFWTGEEDGKFGSGHYVRHPLWPLARTRAYLNLDMIGHAWPAEDLRRLLQAEAPTLVDRVRPENFNDPGYAEWDPALGKVLAQAGRATGTTLKLDPGDGRYGGSDYRDFARAGVPFVRFFGSFFPEYHRPGDTAESLDSWQVRRMARLALATAWMLAY